MKREIKFLDADRNRVTVEINIDKGRFSMSGDCAGSSGQCYDSINPDGENQEKLLELWHKYHLNDMKPGTPRQMELVKGLSYEDALEELSKHSRDGEEVPQNIQKLIDELNSEVDTLKYIQDNSSNAVLNFFISRYTKDGKKLGVPRDIIIERAKELKERVEKLKDILDSTLIFDTLPDGTLYKYGTGWLTEELPEDIEDLVNEVCDAIEEEEEEKRGDVLVTDLELDEAYRIIATELPYDDADKVYAICLMFDTTVNELGDIELDDTSLCYQGTDYLFGDDSEMDEEWDKDLDHYLEECIYPDLPENMRQYFDDEKWKRDAKYDGRGHSLNRYDGGELECKVGDTWYYAYRQ